jgi:hypothetical protein
MTALYTCELGLASGTHVFDVFPTVSPRTSDVMRFNLSPVRCVARIYEIPLDCMIRAATPGASVTALAAILSGAVNTSLGVLPTFLKIKDASGTVLPEIGDIREGTSEKWEDLELAQFELPPGVDQLVSGTRFRLVFRARRSFPDANGVCEFTARRILDADELGRGVRRLVCTIRLDKAAAAAGTISVESTAAIRALLTEPKPTAGGWLRTIGTTDLPFRVEYPLHPLTHVAETESEVTRNQVGPGSPTPPAGAVKAETGVRRTEDPSRGVTRVTTTAETTAPNPEPWIDSNKPSGALVSTEIQVDGSEGKGEWKQLAAIASSGQQTRMHRRFALRGTGRRAGVIEMSGGIAAAVQTGPFVATRLREEIDVYALGPSSLEQLVVPPPPRGGGEHDRSSPPARMGIAEDARAASQRLWLRAVAREYFWLGTDDPAESPELKAAIAAAMTETL